VSDTLSASGAPISGLTAATATNTIDNADYLQEWQWNTETGTALRLSSTSTSATAGSNFIEILRSGSVSGTFPANRGLYSSITMTGANTENVGLYGNASGASTNIGVVGAGTTYGVYGTSSTASAYGIFGAVSGGNSRAINAQNTGSTGTNYAFYGATTGAATTNYGGYFSASGASTNYGGYFSGGTYGVYGVSASSIGVYGETQGSSSAKAVAAVHNGTSGTGYGFHAAVYGAKTTGYGIYVSSEDATNNYGIYVNKGVSQFNDAVHFDITTKTADYTAAAIDHTILVDCTSGNVTITLPAVSAEMAGRVYIVKRIDNSGNTVTLTGNAAEDIDGADDYTGLSAQWKYVKVQATSTAWFIIGNN